MSIAIPARPFARAPGGFDTIRAFLEGPHISNEAAPGVTIATSGWILDTKNEPVEQAWFDVAGISIPLTLDQVRLDVARQLGLGDRDAPKIGFDSKLLIPNEVAPGNHEARVIARARNGGGVYAETGLRVLVSYPRVPAKELTQAQKPRRFELRLRDTQPAPHTRGRGSHTIREECSLRISGYVEDASALHIVATPSAGISVGWNIPCTNGGAFEASLWTGEMKRGLYKLELGSVTGDRIDAVAHCRIDIAGPHYIPALHLTKMLARPFAEIMRFEDAGPSAVGASQHLFVAGRPIGISGWCLDPASYTPALAVYAQVDGERPIPLSHRLEDPRSRSGTSESLCGFGGIVDTTPFAPGPHNICILAAAVSGAGWYVVDERTIELKDHRTLLRDASRI